LSACCCARIKRDVRVESLAQESITRIAPTQAADQGWRQHGSELVSGSLFPRAESYLQKSQECADQGYEGFVLA
jgi:hypothetical protein